MDSRGAEGARGSVYSALVSAWKPSSRWLPSQNGLLLEPPQRQRAILPSGSWNLLPFASSRITGPSIR